VHPDGTPLKPDRYDYRRAAWDAVAFPRLLDRFWQNLRRCVGWNVQYAGCVEPQRRLAPHAHFAIRGTIPRTILRQVATATYHQVWWPTVDTPVYRSERLPTWDDNGKTWRDPDTGNPLQTWREALDTIDANPDADPGHVVRFGPQLHADGVTPGSVDADRTIGYITKYITKNAADCHAITSDRQRQHQDRLWRELLITPCSERCANWLLYGIQPKNVHGKLRPGRCKGRVHQQATLGLGGRRILVSRDWSGKTLADHRYDLRAWVKALLGVSVSHDQADPTNPEPGTPEPVAWELVKPSDPDLSPLSHRLMRALSQRIQWRNAINAAKDRAAQHDTNLSATGTGERRGEP
jgi:hypothetical protein